MVTRSLNVYKMERKQAFYAEPCGGMMMQESATVSIGLTVSRQTAYNLTVNRHSYYPTETSSITIIAASYLSTQNSRYKGLTFDPGHQTEQQRASCHLRN